ncbi:MAG: hypothetical protein ACFFAS_19140 [Promethearchaeota archaeon]
MKKGKRKIKTRKKKNKYEEALKSFGKFTEIISTMKKISEGLKNTARVLKTKTLANLNNVSMNLKKTSRNIEDIKSKTIELNLPSLKIYDGEDLDLTCEEN